LTRPFDKAKYNVLLNGLEATEVKYSLIARSGTSRVDAEFFKKLYLREDERREYFKNIYVGECAFVTDGQHGYHEVDPNSPIAHLTAKNTRGWFANRVNAEPLAKWVDDTNKRSSLQKNDVLLSTRGTVGLCAIVKKEVLPANIDQDIARIALGDNSPLQPEYLVAYLNSCFGQDWMKRNSTGMVQQGLSLESVRQIPVPCLSKKLQRSISQSVQRAHHLLQESETANQQAYNTLLTRIGMTAFNNDENCNSVSFSSSFATTGRLDAEFYQPKYDELFMRIHANAEYVKVIEEMEIYNARGLQPIYEEDGPLAVINSRHILEDGLDYDNFERTGDTCWTSQERARVQQNDILVYTTGANIGRSQPYLSDKPALASNHVNILRIQDEDPLYVAFVMNSQIGRMQTERLSAGTAQAELYPKDISQFVIPFVPKKKQEEIISLLLESREKKAESHRLLEKAKKAVEIAIEQGEEAAMDYLEFGRPSFCGEDGYARSGKPGPLFFHRRRSSLAGGSKNELQTRYGEYLSEPPEKGGQNFQCRARVVFVDCGTLSSRHCTGRKTGR